MTPSPTTPTGRGPERITDAGRIRALAHPVRMELLELLDELGEATATQCAERLGETVANCSFHLRTLAKAGFIEPGTTRGRERPWRPVSRTGRRMDVDPEDPTSLRAVGELASLTVAREADRVQSFFRRQTAPPDGDWVDTVTVSSATFWATAEEMRQLVETVRTLTEPFAGRSADASLRPPGARVGHLFATVHPEEPPVPDPRSDTPEEAPR